MKSSWRYVLVAGLILLTLGVWASQPAISQGQAASPKGATLLTNLNTNLYSAEDIYVCQMGPAAAAGTAWVAGAGRGAADFLRLYRIVGFKAGSTPKIDGEILFSAANGFPPGMGPRGTPGIDLDAACNFAYLPDFFLNTVTKVDINESLKQKKPVVVWQTSVPDAPVDVKLTEFDGGTLLVASSKSNVLTLLDAKSGAVKGSISTDKAEGPDGPGSIAMVGRSHAFVLNVFGRQSLCLDLTGRTPKIQSTVDIETSGLSVVVANPDGNRVYVNNTNQNQAIVLSANGCTLRQAWSSSVGNLPVRLAVGSYDSVIFVSNAFDNTVSVINTQNGKVIDTITIAGPPVGPASDAKPIRAIAVSNDNDRLAVFWEGGTRSQAGALLIRIFDLPAYP